MDIAQTARIVIVVAQQEGAPPDVADSAISQALLLARHRGSLAWVPVQDADDLVYMNDSADHEALWMDDDLTKPGRVVAVYGATDDFPLPRCYFREVGFEEAVQIGVLGGEADARLGPNELKALAPPGDAQALVDAALRRQVDADPEARDYFEGRGRHTRARGALVLRTHGCLRDGTRPTTMTSAVLPLGEDGRRAVSIAFELCARCICEAPNVALADINKALAHFAYRGIVWADVPPPDEQLAESAAVMRDDLACSMQLAEVRPNGAFVRGVRDSGVRVELRVRHKLDYGYMLYDPTGKPRQRFDSADHHEKAAFGPDHDHHDLRRDGRLMRPSFLTGVPLLDVPALLAAINQLEDEPEERQPSVAVG